ncbi:MAG: NADH-quinone oxidoreductase subunit E [Dehalococcoidia bacterium]|nr:MAG: NADH-quinone oxidoreductase subunit E [Dehalococcoidia bacterium]
MSIVATPALARLRGRFPAPASTRVLVHRGTCGDAVDVGGVVEVLRAALGTRASSVVETACDGACWAAPAATVVRPGHRHRFARLDREPLEAVVACLGGACEDAYAGSGERGLLARVGHLDGSLADALAQGAYLALAHAVTRKPDEVIEAVQRAGLSGRGGAHFVTAQKWRLAAANAGPRMLVVNAEEGEPGVFKDRHVLEGDPHRLIEGVLIAAHAAGIARAVIYVNGQARNARRAVDLAVTQAREAGLLDGSALGGTGVQIEVRSGAGGYVCGEESVILNSIEGERPVPRTKPPFATDRGLFDRPTVINNAETLCAATTVFDDPPPPTKLIPLSGAVPRPGLYEVPVDGITAWSGVLAMAGANPQRVRALLLGGPSGRFVLPEEFDVPLDMRGLGAGGVVVLPLDVDIPRITRALAAYNARESCGECTPCREGTPRLVALLEDASANRAQIDALIEVMTEASLCQLGGLAGKPVASALALFPQDFEAAR